MANTIPNTVAKTSKTSGIIAVFKTEDEALEAATQAREKMNYQNYDVFTPYPVHGMDDAMGLKRSWIPYVTFVAGVCGALSALALEIWTSAVDWPINIGGKPFVSLPAFIPITFELTVLFGGLATAFTMIVVAGMPNLRPKILHPGITNDKFVIFIPSTEKDFNEGTVTQFLKGFNPEEISVVTE